MLLCSDCGSHRVELRGSIVNDAPVRCAECGTVLSDWVEFVSSLSARLKQQEGWRSRRLRYYARRQSTPSVCNLILSMSLDEFFWRPLLRRSVGSSIDVEVIRDVERRPGDRRQERKHAA